MIEEACKSFGEAQRKGDEGLLAAHFHHVVEGAKGAVSMLCDYETHREQAKEQLEKKHKTEIETAIKRAEERTWVEAEKTMYDQEEHADVVKEEVATALENAKKQQKKRFVVMTKAEYSKELQAARVSGEEAGKLAADKARKQLDNVEGEQAQRKAALAKAFADGELKGRKAEIAAATARAAESAKDRLMSQAMAQAPALGSYLPNIYQQTISAFDGQTSHTEEKTSLQTALAKIGSSSRADFLKVYSNKTLFDTLLASAQDIGLTWPERGQLREAFAFKPTGE